MKIQEYAKTKTFSEGIPVGDTVVDLEKTEFEDFQFSNDDGKTISRAKMKLPDGKEYYCPNSVVKELMYISRAGGKNARVTRTGTTKDNTRYTVIQV